MSARPAIVWLLLLALGAGTAAAGGHRGQAAKRSSMVDLKGEVLVVATCPQEDGPPLLCVTLDPDKDRYEQVQVLLAPPSTMEEIGFEVAAGDRLQVRIFERQNGTAEAQRVRNLSRGSMVRIRTLYQVPLWTATGTWRGGTCQGQSGAGAGRQGQGPGASGRGPHR